MSEQEVQRDPWPHVLSPNNGPCGVVMHRRYLLIPIVVLGTIALYRNRLRAYLKQASANVRAFDLPTAGMYDALIATVLEGFYARVANEVAAAHPSGKVLEIGSGPGQLAVRLARQPTGVTLTRVDISDAMIERAARRAARAGLSERVQFEVGDVATPTSAAGSDRMCDMLRRTWPP